MAVFPYLIHTAVVSHLLLNGIKGSTSDRCVFNESSVLLLPSTVGTLHTLKSVVGLQGGKIYLS